MAARCVFQRRFDGCGFSRTGNGLDDRIAGSVFHEVENTLLIG
jgi:hypothetical protein